MALGAAPVQVTQQSGTCSTTALASEAAMLVESVPCLWQDSGMLQIDYAALHHAKACSDALVHCSKQSISRYCGFQARRFGAMP